MTKERAESSRRQERLHEVLLAYVEAAQAGAAPDRQTFLDAHPEFAADIVEFLASYDEVNRLAAPLREGEAPRGGVEALRPAGRPRPAEATDVPAAAETAATPELGRLGDYRLLREV